MAAEQARPTAGMSALPPQEVQLQLRNPFVLRVGQVMTGFGIGCGIGIGVGRPINLGALPGIGQALSGAGGLTRSFGDVGRHVQPLIKFIGVKNLEAGVGCGVGIGHGFGAVLAEEADVFCGMEQLLWLLLPTYSPCSSIDILQWALRENFDDTILLFTDVSLIALYPLELLQHTLQSLAAQVRGPTGHLSGNDSLASTSSSFVSTQQSSHFLQTDEELSGPSGEVRNSLQQSTEVFGTKTINSEMDTLRSENEILRTLLRHQTLIEDLKEDNAAVLRALNLNSNTSRVGVDQGKSLHTAINKLSCLKCRRRARRR